MTTLKSITKKYNLQHEQLTIEDIISLAWEIKHYHVFLISNFTRDELKETEDPDLHLCCIIENQEISWVLHTGDMQFITDPGHFGASSYCPTHHKTYADLKGKDGLFPSHRYLEISFDLFNEALLQLAWM